MKKTGLAQIFCAGTVLLVLSGCAGLNTATTSTAAVKAPVFSYTSDRQDASRRQAIENLLTVTPLKAGTTAGTATVAKVYKSASGKNCVLIAFEENIAENTETWRACKEGSGTWHITASLLDEGSIFGLDDSVPVISTSEETPAVAAVPVMPVSKADVTPAAALDKAPVDHPDVVAPQAVSVPPVPPADPLSSVTSVPAPSALFVPPAEKPPVATAVEDKPSPAENAPAEPVSARIKLIPPAPSAPVPAVPEGDVTVKRIKLVPPSAQKYAPFIDGPAATSAEGGQTERQRIKLIPPSAPAIP